MTAGNDVDAQSLPAFQQYQLAFTAHIRNPGQNKLPSKVPASRMKVYTEIVFNNLQSSVSACFPVASKVLGKRAWTRLVRDFFIHYQSATPIFRQIPEEFLKYLSMAPSLPPYLYSLAHYEWIELAISVADIQDATADPAGDLLEGKPVLAASLALLSYDYPVQLISPRFRPDAPLPQPVNLLVFRASDDNVRFIELNALTARLISLLKDGELSGSISGRQALESIATEMGQGDTQSIIQFGHAILIDLKAQGVILGTVIPG
ncbi:MAG TPA: putative DNA-binding domain-containing protein [Methylophilaceae bacterium]|nr:putative DNA-binding domain-containing protein [Methylophilaceae bacterium]